MRTRSWLVWILAASISAGAAPASADPPRAAPTKGAAKPGAKAKDDDAALKAEVIKLRNEGKYDAAIPLGERLVKQREERLGLDHLEVSGALLILARTLIFKADFKRAEPMLQRALVIRKKALGPEHAMVADILSELGNLTTGTQEYERSVAYQKRAILVLEKAAGPEHLDTGRALNNLAATYLEIGEYDGAEPLLTRGLAIKEKALGPRDVGLATSLNNLASLHWERGDYPRSEPLYQRALKIWEDALGPEHPNVAIGLDNLGGVRMKLGDYARAEESRMRALAIREKALGPEHPKVATSLDNLAVGHAFRGDYARAEPLYRRALAIREKVLGPNALDVADTLANLAEMMMRRGDHALAEPLLLRALAIREASVGAAGPAVAASLVSLSEALVGRGDHAGAAARLTRALAIRDKTLGAEHPDTATALHALGDLHARTGQLAAAMPLLQRALVIRDKALGPHHPEVAAALASMASVALAEGRVPDAVAFRTRAAAIQDRHAAIMLAAGGDDEKRAYMATLLDETDRAISLHVQAAPRDPDAVRLALTTILRRKGRILDVTAGGIAALRGKLDPASKALFEELASIDAQLAAQVSRGPGSLTIQRYRANVEALDTRRKQLEADVSARSAAFLADDQPVTLEQIAAAIPEGAALVEIVRYRPFDPRPARDADRWGRPRYAAYALARGRAPSFADLGEAAPIEAAADKLAAGLANHDLRRDPRPLARALDDLVTRPIRAILGGARWIFVSPDARLNLVPLAALVDEDGRFLVERFLFTYLTSGRDLVRFQGAAAPKQGALIVADPDFGAFRGDPGDGRRGTRSADMAAVKFPPLPDTRAEAGKVREALSRGAPSAPRMLLGADATETAIKASRGPSVLHVATHGFFLPTRAGDRGASAAPPGREDPLLRAGLAFAGANARESGNEDGVLTALEASALDLQGTRLVVLSACQTGLGEAVSGEGIYGLRRALVMAGAETQVMSLWDVDSAATSQLMAAYYERLGAGAGRSEAMRDVQLAMLAESASAHPNLWAAFIVSGKPAALDGKLATPDLTRLPPGLRGCSCRQVGWSGEGGGAAISLVAIAAAIARRRRQRV